MLACGCPAEVGDGDQGPDGEGSRDGRRAFIIDTDVNGVDELGDEGQEEQERTR